MIVKTSLLLETNHPKTDYAISKIDAVNRFLKQGTHEQTPSEAAIQQLNQLF